MGSYVNFSISFREFLKLLRESTTEESERALSLPTQTMQKALRGLRFGELTVIGGYPGHGKSALAEQITFHNVKNFTNFQSKKQKCAVYYTLEMPRESLIARFLIQEYGFSGEKLFYPEKLTEEDWVLLNSLNEELYDLSVIINDSVVITTQRIDEQLEELSEEYEPKLVVVDYLQLLDDRPESKNSTETNRLDSIVTRLKDIARHYRCHVIAISSMNSLGKDLEPTGQNLRGTRGLDFAADNVVLVHRPHAMNPADKEMEKYAWLKVTKSRNGPQGQYLMKWHGEKFLFSDTTTEEYDRLMRKDVQF